MAISDKKNILIISSAPLLSLSTGMYLYKPYESELNLWANHCKSISLCCPIWNEDRNLLKSKISFKVQKVYELKDFNFKKLSSILKAILPIVFNSVRIFKAMKSADHIHLRCPGNIGLLGCFVQILFPLKQKSAKYAGNWDPKSNQPWSYRLQKWILSNTFLTRNMQVLVYGEWGNQTKNIRPFFTASYHKNEIVPLQALTNEKTIRFVFAGSLVAGKNPFYAVELINRLKHVLSSIQLDLYGEGVLREALQQRITENGLENEVHLHGNQNAEVLKRAFQNSHFVVLPSKSEGWPKVLAEGMFWGCVPLATPISCVPNMLDYGNRGIILQMNIDNDVIAIKELILDKNRFQTMRQLGANWSRTYTLDYFESEMSKIIQS